MPDHLFPVIKTFIIPFIQAFVPRVYSISVFNFPKYSKQLAAFFWLCISALHTVAG